MKTTNLWQADFGPYAANGGPVPYSMRIAADTEDDARRALAEMYWRLKGGGSERENFSILISCIGACTVALPGIKE